MKASLVTATVDELRDSGFAGASARAIAERAGVSQALVFYHFGSMEDLLVAALTETSRQRMDAYRSALRGVTTAAELFETAGRVFSEDLDSGHLKVLAEIIAASSAQPELGARVAQAIEPWIELTEATLTRVLASSPVATLLPVRDLATGIVSLYIGLELLTHLRGDRAPADSLFATAVGVASLLDAFVVPQHL